MTGSASNSGLRDSNGLTRPDYFQRAVPLSQAGNADMITKRDTGQGFASVHDVSDRAGTIIGSQMHVEGFKFAFGLFSVKRHQQGLSGADIAALGEAIHGFQILQR